MSVPKPRVISLNKREGQSYGFFLRIEQGEDGHLIRALEMGGPAELAGLKDGDRIVRVNGTYVDNLEHSQVAEMVKKSGMSVTFHVLGEEAYKKAKMNGINLSDPQSQPSQGQTVMNGGSAPSPKLKLCYLQKTSEGFGFSVKSTKGEMGISMMDVVAGGVADKSGVNMGDRLVEINGENVDNSTHDQAVEKIKASGNSVMFLLADEDTYKFYKNKRITMGSGLASVKHLPMKPRIADMTKGADGYGYFLKEDPKMPGHFIGEIDRKSPAERAGLKEMDRLVALEGEEVDQYTHEQVVDKIRRLGNRCCLLVVDAETDKMYKMGAASPLLYWEEMRGSLPKPSQPQPEPEPKPAPPPFPEATPAPETPLSSPVPPYPGEEYYKPKLCRLVKTSTGYGFHLNGIQGVHGQYIKDVVKGGAADRAGLEDEDIVVEVNGLNVEKSTHDEVVKMIRSSGDTLVLLVAEKAAYDHLKAKGVAITQQLLDSEKNTPEPCVPAITPAITAAAAPAPAAASPAPAAAVPEPAAASPAPAAAAVAPAMPQEEQNKRSSTPPAQPRARTPSISSTSSSDSEDVRL
uniref:PDZ domain containing 1 n=1 Tax=Astyanax mexicanus TaxID=7994 RepID=A0A3B1KAJ8_ASTMX